jgi:Tfp pilus assembly protein PilX
MRAFITYRRSLIADQRGIVLYSSLMLLALIMAVGVQAIVSTQSNFQISSNLRSENVAFYISEAGIEWSKNELARTTAHPPPALSYSSAISSGTFSVATISTAAVSPLMSNTVIRSTGKFASSSQIVQAELIKRSLLADAALGLRGNASHPIFVGNDISISGLDHDPATGKPIPNVRPYAGISVSNAATKEQIDTALEADQLSRISGTDRQGATIAETENLTTATIVRLADELCSAENSQLIAIAADTTLSLAEQHWGNRSVPELHCLDGSPGAGDSVAALSNSSGAGILVARNADLVLEGGFRWEGLIIITGSRASLKVSDAGAKEVIGAMIINETGPYSETNPSTLDLNGVIKILFSRAALQAAATVVPASALTNAYTSLPSEVVQSYWRLITP